MKSYTEKIVYIVVFVLVSAVVGCQVFMMMNSSHDTEEAVLYTVSDSISFKGIFVRDETPIYYNGEGVVNYLVKDGEKAAKNSVVAEIYDTYDQIEYRNTIDNLKAELSELVRAQSHGTTDYAQPGFISDQIDEKYRSLLLAAANGDYSEFNELKSDMRTLMNIYNISVNAETDYKELEDQLNSEITSSSEKLTPPIGSVKVSKTGYFVSSLDGYESALTSGTIGELTAEDINQIISNPQVFEPINGTIPIGKIFEIYKWQMIGVINTKNQFITENTYSMSISSSSKDYSVYIESMQPTGNADEYIIILSCDEMDEALVKNRVERVEIDFGDYTGLKVPRDAIRFLDGEKGVYVMQGQTVKFKKISVIYEGDDFVLSENTSDPEYLNLYNEILLEPLANVLNNQRLN